MLWGRGMRASLMIVLLVSACNDSRSPEMRSCRGALSSYCNGTCQSYDAEVADLRAAAANHPLFCFEQIGSCGDGHFAEVSLSGFDDTILFYDAAGGLLGAQVHSDTNAYCGNSSFSIDYGTVPSCERKVTET